MAHLEQQHFCRRMKAIFPHYFKDVRVLDVGSADICGNNKYLFPTCEYTGLDLWPGPNVDIVCPGHLFSGLFGLVISTNCLEHDECWEKTVANMVKMTHPLGMLIIQCASTGYPEHGTTRTSPHASPATTDYYRNLTYSDIEPYVGNMAFKMHWYNPISHDLYFIGFKKKWPVFTPSILNYIRIELKYFLWHTWRDFKNAPKYYWKKLFK
jgi:hypothetical protein